MPELINWIALECIGLPKKWPVSVCVYMYYTFHDIDRSE